MKKTIILILALITSSIIYAQFIPMQNFPSPKVGSLGKYGNVPVSSFTGQPNISIPIYNLKEGELELQISLDYILDNVKPSRRTGWCGLGWSVNAGGYITRNVRGCYDEQKSNDGTSIGFYDNYDKLQDVVDESTIESHKDNFLGEQVGVEIYELMTDEYHFQFGEYSGNFYLDENGEWVVASDDNIKVEFDSTSGFRLLADLRSEINVDSWNYKYANTRFFDSFTLIDPNGVKYKFGGEYAVEYSINYYRRNTSYLIPTTWYLTEIESPKGHMINFEYEADLPICEIQYSAFSSYVYLNYADPSGFLFSNFLSKPDGYYSVLNNSGKRKLGGYLIFPVYLKEISSSFETIDIHSAQEIYTEQELGATSNIESLLYWNGSLGFSDPLTNTNYDPYLQFNALIDGNLSGGNILTDRLKWRLLRGISIAARDSNYTKTYYFEYERYTRRLLTKIAERKGDFNPVEDWRYQGNSKYLYYETPSAEGYSPRDYQFNYNTNKTFPRYIFASVDHWGYYNGYTSSGMETEGERSYSESIEFDDDYYSSRMPPALLDVAQAMTLNKIVYPTGGSTVLEYQKNRYSRVVPLDQTQELIDESGNGGGVCISKVSTYDNDNHLLETKKYFYSDQIPSSTSGYQTSGILLGKKHYYQHYYGEDDNENTYDMYLASEGGFLTTSANRSDPHIEYPSVIEAIYDTEENLKGYTRYRYSSFDTDNWGGSHMDDMPVVSNVEGSSYNMPVSSNSLERGKLLSIEYFDSDNRKQAQESFKYKRTNSNSIKTLYQEKQVFRYGPYPSNYACGYVAYLAPIYTSRYLLAEKSDISYFENDSIQRLEKYEYDDIYKLPIKRTSYGSNDDSLSTILRYPFDIGSGVYSLMEKVNMLNYPIVKKIYNNNAITEATLTSYRAQNDFYVPDSILMLETLEPMTSITEFNGSSNSIDSHFKESKIKFNRYNSDGNLLEYVDQTGHLISMYYVPGYCLDKPIIVAHNISYTELKSAIESIPLSILLLIGDFTVEDMKIVITELNEAYDIHAVGYSYDPTIGLTSETNERGITTRYEYDSFGRLQSIKDDDGNIVKSYEYNYAN